MTCSAMLDERRCPSANASVSPSRVELAVGRRACNQMGSKRVPLEGEVRRQRRRPAPRGIRRAQRMYARAFREAFRISPLDTMFRGNEPRHYLAVGRSACDCIIECLRAAEVSEVRRILDFGCGYGRVLRVLRREFPDAVITASDVDRGGVDFCAETFGATGVYSSTDPRELKFADQLDLIWVGSVFTHLEREPWEGFMAALGRALANDGVLVFTTQGPEAEKRLRRGDLDYGLEPPSVEAILKEYADSGFGFGDSPNVERHDYPESGRYGITVMSDPVVRELVDRAGLRVMHYIPTGWDNHQDVFACRLAGAVADQHHSALC